MYKNPYKGMQDVIIVGAGPVGLYLAGLLEKQAKVLVLERSRSLGHKACSGLVSTRLGEFVRISKGWVEHEVKGAVLHSPGGRAVRVKKPRTAAYVIDRHRFDRWLGKQVKSRVLLGAEVKGVKIGDGVEVKTNKGVFRAKLVAGADGCSSIVGRGFRGKPKEVLNGLIGIVGRPDASEDVEMWYNPRELPEGFYWKIPRGKRTEYGVLGKGVSFGQLERFFGIKSYKKEAAAMPLGQVRSYSRRAVLVGDAAGQVKPWSIDGEESIIVKEDGLIKNIKMSDFVNGLIQTGYKNDVLVFSPSKNASKLGLFRIRSALKHQNKYLHEIVLKKGYRIKTTGSHSVMVVSDHRLESKKVSELKPGKDKLLVIANVPNNENLKEINLIESIISKTPKFVPHVRVLGGRNLIFKGRSEIPKRYQSVYWCRDSIPLKEFSDKGIVPKDVEITFNPRKKNIAIPNIIKITPELCRLLGFYLAEGDASKGKHIHLSFGKADVENGNLDSFIDCVKRVFGIDVSRWSPRQNPSTGEATEFPLSFGGKLLAWVFNSIFEVGGNAHTKQIPYMIFNVPDKLKIEFLKAYLKGDGSARVRMPKKRRNWSAEVSVKTASRKLASDLTVLSFQLGLLPSIEGVKSREHSYCGKKIKTSTAYKITFCNHDDLERLLDVFPERIKITKYLKAKKKRQSKMRLPKEFLEKEMIDALAKTSFRNYLINRYNSRHCKTVDYDKLRLAINQSQYDDSKIKLIKNIIDNKILLLPVKEVRKIKSSSEVFDVEVPETNMFVGGVGPIVLHNSGGGIIYGFTAARIAARVIAKALETRDFSERALSEYEKEWRKVLGKAIRRGALARGVYRRMPGFVLEAAFWLLRPFESRLSKKDMDFPV